MKLAKILAMMMLICIATATAAYIYFPLPVNGRLMGVNVENREVLVENIRSGKTMSTITNIAGEYMVDWANSDDNGGAISKYMNGDVFKITVTACSTSAECVKTVTYTGQPQIYTAFDLNNVVLACPGCPACPSCSGGGGGGCYINQVTQEKCAEEFPCTPETCKGVTCPVEPGCPEPTVCPEPIVCQDPAEVPVCEECNDGDNTSAVFAAIIAFLIGGGTAYVAFGNKNKIKLKKVNGVTEVWHQHPSISGYHSINTMHRAEPHKKGELVPIYEKDSAGKWHYKGGA